MKINNLLCIFLISSLILACEEESPIKQLRIDLKNDGISSYGSESSNGSYLSSKILYKDFNISNYPKAESVKLIASIRIGHPNHECLLELANSKDSTIIQGSLLTTNSISFVWKESENLIDSFKDENIDLTLFIRPSLGGVLADISAAYLYIEMK